MISLQDWLEEEEESITTILIPTTSRVERKEYRKRVVWTVLIIANIVGLHLRIEAILLVVVESDLANRLLLPETL